MFNVIRKVSTGYVDEDAIQVGYQIRIPLKGFGTFTATAEEMTDSTILFIFDDIVSRKPMNEANTNVGGFKGSQLYKWLQDVLLPSFPDYLRERISELTIPTIGQVSGWSDAWDKEHFEGDNDQLLPLMKDRKHRIASFEGDFVWYWLQNASKKDWSSAAFANVSSDGHTNYSYASNSSGVRPAFRLVKEKSRGPVPRKSGRYPWDFDADIESILRYCQNDVMIMSELTLKMEIQEKEIEIDELKKEIEEQKKKNRYDEGANEVKALVDSFIRAGFTQEQAFRMVMNMMTAMLGGMK